MHQGILDLHKPFVDEIILVSKSGKPMKRIPDLVDVWFDSGRHALCPMAFSV